ncbi:MAG: response regulator transcription factor, partial [bacterium]
LQKLVNRIKTFVPNEKKNSLAAGPIELDLDQRLVRCGTKQSRLTPRLAALLKMFLEKPGELIERQEIFQKVWETEYLGDTRPLDVHISWLRKKIEDDPRKPQFIKTIRGVGYRLDVEIAPTKKRSISHST